MPAGRPTEGAEHVEKLEGDPNEKKRLKAILQVLAGEKSLKEACEELNISEARFHVLRRQALQSALDGLAPTPPGRPRRTEEIDPSRLDALEKENGDLRVELEGARIRADLALVMPQVLKRRAGKDDAKKNDSRRRRRR